MLGELCLQRDHALSIDGVSLTIKYRRPILISCFIVYIQWSEEVCSKGLARCKSCARLTTVAWCRVANANGSAEKESPTGSSPKRQKQPTISRESSPDSSNEADSGAANVLQDLTAISEPPPPSWSLSALLNLRKPAPQPQYSDQFPDAISLGILSQTEVEALFDL